MPKAEKLSTNRSAVLARERREREKKTNEYNAALKEFLQFKYDHIIAEFNPIYENMMAHRPANLVYTNTNEFRLWQKQEMEKVFSSSSNGKEDEQLPELLPEQQQQLGEQLPELGPLVNEQQQDEQQPELGPLVNEQQDERQPELGPLVNEQQQQDEQQLPELDPLVNELVGDPDEGIALDVWEELQGDIEDFNYQLEVELDQYLQ